MSLRINSNTAAFNAYRNLSINDGMLSKSLEKLSSGFRVNRAADDASGLVKSESLRSDIRGLGQAVKNAQDGISFVQTAEGALVEVHSILQRINELSVSAANTATSDGAAEQAEVDELLLQLDAIGTQTRFAGIDVFSASEQTFHVGSAAGETIGVTVGTLSASGLSIGSIDLTSDADGAITSVGTAIDTVSTLRADLGAKQNRLETTVRNLQVTIENLSASESRIRDTDMAAEMANFTRNQIMMQAGTSMLAQANSIPQNVLSLLR